MKKRLTKLRVGGSGLKRIKMIFFLMRPTTFPTIVFSPCSTKYNVQLLCFNLAPLVFCGTTLLNWPQDYWTNDVDAFLKFSLLNSSVIIHSSNMFIFMYFDNWNTFAKVGCASWSNMASHIRRLSSLSNIIPINIIPSINIITTICHTPTKDCNHI